MRISGLGFPRPMLRVLDFRLTTRGQAPGLNALDCAGIGVLPFQSGAWFRPLGLGTLGSMKQD